MKKIILLAFISLSFTSMSTAQNLDWAKSMGGGNYDVGNAIVVDAFGNIYATGFFQDTVDFDPNVGVSDFVSLGSKDIFIQKLDAAGNLLWIKVIGGSLDDFGESIILDDFGNVYITGSFTGTVDFDPNGGVSNLTATRNQDVFFLKLNVRGDFIWAKSIGGLSFEQGVSSTIDDFGNIYTTGLFQGIVDFDPNVGVVNLTARGNWGIFIQKLDSVGDLVWAKSMGGVRFDAGQSIAVDAFGNVYTTGYFEESVDFDPGTGSFRLTSMGRRDIFIQKLDARGDFIWAKSMGGDAYDEGYAIAVDALGNIYTTGHFQSTVDFDPNAGTSNFTAVRDAIFIQKLDSSGNLLWIKSMDGDGGDVGESIAVDGLGNVFTTGYFSTIVDFDPNAGVFNLSTSGDNDIFIQKLDPAGNLLWAKSMGGLERDRGGSITLDTLGNIYTTGYFGDTTDFDPGMNTVNLNAIGHADIFIQKLKCASAIIARDLISTCGAYTWIDGITYTANNNAATHILSSSAGCDSTITLDLTINTVDATLTTIAQSITANATSASYQWLDCGNAYAVIAGETQQTFNASANGSYAVAVTQNGCTDTSQCVTILTVDILKNILFKNVSIFPNPTTGFVNVDLGDLKEAVIKVFDLNGQLIYQQENIKTPSYRFELKAAAGVYFVEASAQGARQQYKLLKK